MRVWLFRCLLGFGLIALGWHVFEFAWDRKLFAEPTAVVDEASADGSTTDREETTKPSPKTMTDKSEAKVVNVGVKEASRLIEEQPDLQVVDVRPESSYRSSHLPGARSVRYAGGELETAAAESLDRDRPILVYCDGGFRSRLSLSAFREAGFREIYHLHRGILSWKLLGGTCEKSASE